LGGSVAHPQVVAGLVLQVVRDAQLRPRQFVLGE